MQDKSKKYAVAIRDGEELFLFLRITRNGKGEVFVIHPRDSEWDAHASYHADGRIHQKSYDQKFMVREVARPAAFSQTETLLHGEISQDHARAINVPCKPDQFLEIFEIPNSNLRLENRVGKCALNIIVDLTAPGGEPNLPTGARTIRQKSFQDAVPWVTVTVYDLNEWVEENT